MAVLLRIDITAVSQTLTLMNLVQLQNPQPPISSSRVEQRIVIPRIGVQVTAGRPTVLVYLAVPPAPTRKRWVQILQTVPAAVAQLDQSAGLRTLRLGDHSSPAAPKMPSSYNGLVPNILNVVIGVRFSTEVPINQVHFSDHLVSKRFLS